MSISGGWTIAGAGPVWHACADRDTASDTPAAVKDVTGRGRDLTTFSSLVIRPRRWQLNGRRAYWTRQDQAQYAQDVSGDALTFWEFLSDHSGATFLWVGELYCLTGDQVQIFGTWNVQSSNQNAFSAIWTPSSERLEFFETQNADGGQVRVSAHTTPGRFHILDVLAIAWVTRPDGSYTIWVARQPRLLHDPTDRGDLEVLNGTISGPVGGICSRGLTLGGDSANARGQGSMAEAAAFRYPFSASDVAAFLSYVDRRYGITPVPFISGRYRGVPILHSIETGDCGDSRITGYNASQFGVTDCRHIRTVLAAQHPTLRSTAIGPHQDVDFEPTFSFSGAVTRALLTSHGLSPRTPDPGFSLDNFADELARVDLLHLIVGINNIRFGGSAATELDWEDENLRLFEYAWTLNPAMRIAFYTEPQTTLTVTGAVARENQSNNRARHAIVNHCRRQGKVIALADLWDLLDTGSDFDVDEIHWPDSGHAKVGQLLWDVQRWLAGWP